MSVPEMTITQSMIDRCWSWPGFSEWLHGDGYRSILVPLITPRMAWARRGAETITSVRVDRVRCALPAPWAIQEYRYFQYVAVTQYGQEIARSECWRWFNPVAQLLNPIPPAEALRG